VSLTVAFLKKNLILSFDSRTLDAEYYIRQVLIPPLDRILGLVGADVRSWYSRMPRMLVVDPGAPSRGEGDEDETPPPLAFCFACGKEIDHDSGR
jgi:hypothetical protein